jgi:hypothetical protein
VKERKLPIAGEEAVAFAKVKKLALAVQKEVPAAPLEEPAFEKDLLASVETSIRGRMLVQLQLIQLQLVLG